MGICIRMTKSLHCSLTTSLVSYAPVQIKGLKFGRNVHITEHYQCLFLNNKIMFHLLFLLFYSLQGFKNKITLTL